MANTAIGWIQDHSHGLTQIGVQKLSESIGAYVFMTLSSQSSVCSSIIGKDRRAPDTQSIWRSSFEELVKSNSGIGDKIRRYQDVLQYASSKVDFNVREGVYMLPSNMVLAMGNKTGFNNKILVSEHNFKIGVNKLVNQPKEAFKTVPREAFKTVSKEAFKRASKEAFKRAPKEAFKRAPKEVTASKTLPHEERVLSQEHSDEMMAISVLLIGTSLVFCTSSNKWLL